MLSVPFELYRRFLSYPAGQGIVRVTGEDLLLDVRKLNPWTWSKSNPREFRIPLKHLEALEFKKHWFLFHVWLRLRVRKLECLVDIPTADGAEVILWCRRRHKAAAQELANAIQFRLLDQAFVDENTPNRI